MERKLPYFRRLARTALAGACLWGMTVPALAQPICSIDLGPDTTICQGNSVILQGPAGFPNYSWSTGETSQDITVNAAGNYTCQVSYPTGNLVTNGNFTAGNLGFNTMFNYGTPLTNEGNYWIGTNAALYHPQFQGTGNGQFMMVNAGWMHSGWRFWCQTLDVCPGQTYVISFRAASLATVNPPVLAWFVNNNWTGVEHTPPVTQGQWQNFNVAWTAPAGTFSAEFCIQVSSGWGTGNDFGFDDVDIRSTVVLSDQVTVNVTPLPVFDLGPDVTLCDGQSLTLDPAVPGGTYTWQDGSTAPSFVVNTAGNYAVDVTANGCSASDDIDVNYNPLPVVDLGPDLSLCTGETVVLDVTQPGATYAWSDGSGASTLTVSGPGTYGVNVWLNNCFVSDQVDIVYNAIPTVALGPDQAICAGEQANFDATTPGATYLWQDGSTGPTYTSSTSEVVQVDVTVNNCTGSDAASVVVNPLPVFDLGPDVTVCPGTVVNLNASLPGATYLWQDGSTAATFAANTPGTYTVDVTVANCTTSDVIVVDHYTLPAVDLGADVTLCAGNTTTLGVTIPGSTYIWSTGEVSPTISTGTAGIYWVDVIQNGCPVRDSLTVNVTPLPVVDLGADTSVCPGDQAVLDATTAGAFYLWSTGAGSPTLSVGPGTYSVQVTVDGCPGIDEITVNAFPGASVDLGNDTTLCPGQQILLDATQAGASHVWQDGSTASTFLANAAGTYSVDLTDANGCEANDAITVQFATPQAIDLGNDTTLCLGASLTLDATVLGGSYTWSTGATTSSIAVATAGNYSVVVQQGNCSTSDAITVQVSALPEVALGNDLTLCPGETILLDAGNAGSEFLWNTGSTAQTLLVTQAGTYSVTVTNSADCAVTDAITVNYATPGAVDLGPDATLCQGEQLVLDATIAGATYLWSTGATTPTISVGNTGTYSVEVFQGSCSVTDAIQVQVNPVPVFDLGNDQVLCAGESTVLDATSAGATYLWSTGATTPTITASTTGTYSVTATLNGCSTTDDVVVTVLSTAAVNLGPDATLCQGEQLVLDATIAGATYLWSTGATTPTISVGNTGTYSVEVFQGSCSVTDAIQVQVNPVPVFDLGNDQVLCAGESTVLDATSAGATYLWSTGATTPNITASTTGTYSVTATLNGCSTTDDVLVTVLSTAAVNLGPDATLCQGEQLVLDATIAGATYLWSTGATTPTISVGNTGTYSVEVFQGSCSVTDAIQVQVNPVPVFDLGNDQVLCAGESTVLDATSAGSTYLWSTGATTPTITASTTGTYSVTATLNGCSTTDDVAVIVLSTAAVNLGPDATLCQGEQLVLDATIAGATYLWSTGATTPTISVGTTGTYSVEVFQGSCSVTDAIQVQVNPVPVFDLGNDQVLCAGESTVLDATSAGATYLWSTGATTPTITASTTGTYSVTATLNGCSTTDDVAVTVLTPSVLDLGPDISICAGTEVELDATLPGATYLWSTGETSPTVEVGSNGTYWVTVSQAACSISDTVVVTVNDPGTLDLGPDVVLCDGEAIVLDASIPGANYLWEDGSTQATITVSLAGNYSVVATVDGCSVSDEVAVSVNPIPSIDLGDDVSLCPGLSATLNAATAGATYLWSDGSTASSLVVTVPGNYSVEVTVDGCSASDGLEVIGIVGPVVELGPDTTLCLGQSLVLDVTQESAEYLWEDGSTLPVRTITEAGDYRVEVVRNGCTADGDILVSIFDPSSVDLGPDQRLCPGESATLTCPVTDAQLIWNTGATGGTIVVSTTGTYWVEASTTGCTARDSVVVTMVPLTPPDLGPDQVLCVGDTAQAEVEVGTATVLWSTGSTGPSISVTNTGTYGVTLELEGCTASDEVRFTFLPTTFEIYLGWDNTLCPGEELLLSAETPFAEYLWSTGSEDAAIVVNTVGTYTVQVSTACAVSSSTMSVVEGECAPEVNVPNAFTPNGDGINDVFQVVMSNAPFELVVNIFDRWGELIYTSSDPDDFWDGTYDGTPAQDGVYVYTVRYRSIADAGVVSKQLTGHVSLLR